MDHSTPSKLSISSSIALTFESGISLFTNAICVETILKSSANALFAGTLAKLSGNELLML